MHPRLIEIFFQVDFSRQLFQDGLHLVVALKFNALLTGNQVLKVVDSIFAEQKKKKNFIFLNLIFVCDYLKIIKVDLIKY